jgi:hypothetical protein
MLYRFIDEVRSGMREDSVVSTNSLSIDEQEAWRVVRKELEDVGITAQLFIEHSVWIKETLQHLKDTGALQEQPLAIEPYFTEGESSFDITSTDNAIARMSTDEGAFPNTGIPHTTVPFQQTSSYQPYTGVGTSGLSIDNSLPSDAANKNTLFCNTGEEVHGFLCRTEGCSRSKVGKGFTTRALLIKHRSVHEPREHPCLFCPSSNYPYLYARKQSLRKHIRTAHKYVDANSPQFQAALAFRSPRRELMVLASGERFAE